VHMTTSCIRSGRIPNSYLTNYSAMKRMLGKALVIITPDKVALCIKS